MQDGAKFFEDFSSVKRGKGYEIGGYEVLIVGLGLGLGLRPSQFLG